MGFYEIDGCGRFSVGDMAVCITDNADIAKDAPVQVLASVGVSPNDHTPSERCYIVQQNPSAVGICRECELMPYEEHRNKPKLCTIFTLHAAKHLYAKWHVGNWAFLTKDVHVDSQHITAGTGVRVLDMRVTDEFTAWYNENMNGKVSVSEYESTKNETAPVAYRYKVCAKVDESKSISFWVEESDLCCHYGVYLEEQQETPDTGRQETQEHITYDSAEQARINHENEVQEIYRKHAQWKAELMAEWEQEEKNNPFSLEIMQLLKDCPSERIVNLVRPVLHHNKIEQGLMRQIVVAVMDAFRYGIMPETEIYRHLFRVFCNMESLEDFARYTTDETAYAEYYHEKQAERDREHEEWRAKRGFPKACGLSEDWRTQAKRHNDSDSKAQEIQAESEQSVEECDDADIPKERQRGVTQLDKTQRGKAVTEKGRPKPET